MSLGKSFIDEDKIKSQMTLRQLFTKLWPYMSVYRRLVAVIVALVLCFTFLGRALPFLFGYAIDHGLQARNWDVILACALIYLGCEVLRTATGFGHTYLTEKLGNQVLYDLRSSLIAHVQRLPTTFFDKNPTGRIVTRVTHDVLSLSDLFNQGLTTIIVCLIEMVAITFAMLYVSPRLTVLTFLLSPIAVYLSVKVSQRARFYFSETKKKVAQQNSFTAESLNGMKVLQLFHQTENRQGRFAELSNDYKEAQLKTVKQFALLWPIIGFFNIATIACALIFSALYQSQLALSIGQITTFILLAQSFYMPIRTLLERYNQFQNSLAGADRIFTLFSETPESDSGFDVEIQDIVLQNLSFRYSKDDPYALKNISLKIPKGQSVALVGRTGSGKTTLISLLQKLYEYHEGEIYFGSKPLKEISIESLRKKIGIVQQDPYIFKGTLLSNLTLHDEKISEDEAHQALVCVGGHNLIKRTPLGLHMPIEERGGNLSTGEKQIISFARVLAHNPDILFLDEATANVDSESEKIIQKATQEVLKGRTSIVIAHRLSTITDCDQIVVLDKGQIAESGQHRDLLAQKGLYASYYLGGSI